MIRLIFLLFFVGHVQCQFCMLQFKENWVDTSIGSPFFSGPQKSDADCKKLCIARQDCVTADYSYDAKRCKLFNLKGVMYLGESEKGKTNAWIKFPTSNCGDNSQLDQAINQGTVKTLSDGKKYLIRWQNKSTLHIARQ
ncbi:hypothetical protein CAEBREN_24437 [Caenorhabditis brenneri]|uniref:Apple domain-containing protein n=1 Tax=Caenorhabditis brenneri TaxID=135651 RepID=G0NMB1_CAEBE|nr:hypothetical protein CAEBREN_01510 [Caenorhabditis brenneri]EGT34053.1 hypothetical protein CAEBREN_24437 [Caenorhabditis brenneri]